jgi:hypothetical protein
MDRGGRERPAVEAAADLDRAARVSRRSPVATSLRMNRSATRSRSAASAAVQKSVRDAGSIDVWRDGGIARSTEREGDVRVCMWSFRRLHADPDVSRRASDGPTRNADSSTERPGFRRENRRGRAGGRDGPVDLSLVDSQIGRPLPRYVGEALPDRHVARAARDFELDVGSPSICRVVGHRHRGPSPIGRQQGRQATFVLGAVHLRQTVLVALTHGNREVVRRLTQRRVNSIGTVGPAAGH